MYIFQKATWEIYDFDERYSTLPRQLTIEMKISYENVCMYVMVMLMI